MYYWTVQYAIKYVAREVWQVLIRASKMVEFISGVFFRYGTVRDFNISQPDGTVPYGKGTVPVLYCTVPYFILA